MAEGAGYKSLTAFRKEGTQVAYATPVECGAGHQMPVLPPVGLERSIAKQLDNAIRHHAGIGDSSVLLKSVGGTCEFDLPYRGLEYLLYCAMGFCDGAGPETVDTGVYKHTIELAENLHTEPIAAGDGIIAGDGWLAGDNKVRRGTLCIEKTISIWEYISCMVQAMTIKGNAKRVSVEFEMISYNLDLASAVNTSSSAWSIPNTDWDWMLFQDMVLWIDDYSDSVALTSADAVGVSEFQIKLENNLKVTQDSQSGLYIAEPRRDGKRLVTGSFTFPRYENDTFLGKLDAQTAMMAMMRFIGPQIGATGYYHTFWVWLPTFRFDAVDAPVDNPGLLPVTHTFTAEIPAAVPSGFPATAETELLLQIQNDLDANLLQT